MSSSPENDSRFTAADRFAAAVGLLALVAGLVLLAATSGFTASVVGIGLLGVAGVAFVALAFLLVGESEDRDHRKGVM